MRDYSLFLHRTLHFTWTSWLKSLRFKTVSKQYQLKVNFPLWSFTRLLSYGKAVSSAMPLYRKWIRKAMRIITYLNVSDWKEVVSPAQKRATEFRPDFSGLCPYHSWKPWGMELCFNLFADSFSFCYALLWRVWLYLPTAFTVGLVPSYIIVSPGYTAALVEEEKRKQQQQRPKITLVISITESPKRRKQLLKPLPVRQMVEEVQLKNLSGQNPVKCHNKPENNPLIKPQKDK